MYASNPGDAEFLFPDAKAFIGETVIVTGMFVSEQRFLAGRIRLAQEAGKSPASGLKKDKRGNPVFLTENMGGVLNAYVLCNGNGILVLFFKICKKKIAKLGNSYSTNLNFLIEFMLTIVEISRKGESYAPSL